MKFMLYTFSLGVVAIILTTAVESSPHFFNHLFHYRTAGPIPSWPSGPGRPFVSFYQNRYCQGQDYQLPLSNIAPGQCVTLPKELCDWNLSVTTSGMCIQVFENEGCVHAPASFYGGSPSGFKIIGDRCTSTKLNGFDVVRSFRPCAC